MHTGYKTNKLGTQTAATSRIEKVLSITREKEREQSGPSYITHKSTSYTQHIEGQLIMREQHPILCFPALLLLILASCVSAGHYYIVSDDSRSMCQSYPTGTCFTLAEFDKYFDPDSDITLSFLPGEHLLTERLTINGIYTRNVTLTGENSLSTIKCQGTSGFEFNNVQSLNVAYLEFTGCGNVISGGAISINGADNVLIKDCHFITNQVLGDYCQGGAIYAEDTATLKIEDSMFDGNSAGNHSPEGTGGAISVFGDTNTKFTSNRNHYINNRADFKGGAIYVFGNFVSNSEFYINNVARLGGGGAIYVDFGNIISTNNYYIKNSAGYDGGGAIFVTSGNKSSTNDYYINNSARGDGGAIYVEFGNNINSTNDHYINNTANGNGGAMFHTNSLSCTYSKCSNSEISGDNFEGNSAVEGGAIFKTGGKIKIGQSNMTDNFASKKGIVYMNSVSLELSEGVNFMNNQGSLYVFNTQVEFEGTVAFLNNFGDSGGAITAILSQISSNVASTITICNNTAKSGAGIFLAQSRLHVHNDIELKNNHATDFGGGIYAYQSEIGFMPETTQKSEISNNTASNGGAIYAIASSIQISKTYLDFDRNTATANGGAIYLEQNSKIYVQKNVPEDYRHTLNIKLDFTSNSAEKGGAIYVADNTNIGVLCSGANTDSYKSECFLQTLGFSFVSETENYINTFFHNNIAHQTGSDIYGGLLDRCTINPIAELLLNTYSPLNYMSLGGFDYIKATTQIEQITDYSPRSNQPDYLIGSISRSDVKRLISSDAVRVEFCFNNSISSDYSHLNVWIKKGQTFTVSLVAVDQVGNPLNATIIASFASESGNGHIKDNQLVRLVGNKCTELEYNVYSHDDSAQLHIHADGPCGDIGVSTKTINLNFLPCTCPVGFEPSASDNDCLCECSPNTLAFCLDNVISLNYSLPDVYKKKGELFTVSVATLDQMGSVTNATIISSFSSESGKGHLKDSQVVQQIGNQCTELEYNVYSLDNSAQLHINWYVNTPCGNRAFTKTLNLIFLPCSCPVGLQPAATENDCICECNVSILFCVDNVKAPNYNHPNVSIKKGELFTVSVVAVDQLQMLQNATVITSFSSKSGKGHLKDSQVVQKIGNQCTELEYNVYAIDNSAQLHLNWYADTTCGNQVSTKTLNLTFNQCTCPVGSQPSRVDNDCICECDQIVDFLFFCLDNDIYPNYNHFNLSKKKGELFTIGLVAVDHLGNPMNATIISSFSSESGKGHLKDKQVVQQLGNNCTELEYNVYSLDNSAQLHLSWYADTPCGTMLSRTLNISFLPCTCPVGFQPVPSDNDCICECDKRLKQHQITSCFVQNETILVESNTWIALSNYTNGTGFVIHDCPFDYCVQEPVYISLNSTDSADNKCANNRTGILCGACNEDLSLVFGSSRCKECSDYYIFLLIPFALAGIALVTFILLLNLTVATGTIHGLIFYANILTADHSLFLPFATPNVLTVFISWLNLDLGIETCFYNGMDSYGKFLLQLAFPTYVFILIGTIIVLCEVSKKFATLLSNRNPVATLCTLFLLSYSKLIRTIITALQFTQLDYPDGSRELVWLYGANVPYFSVSHIPRFIAAFLVVIFGAIYTILLFFGQWFPRCSNRKFMKWTKNTKYNAFIDAYHAPFTPRHRYWIGLLLFALTTHNIVAAMTADSPVAILSAGCVSVGLILLKLLATRIYKNRLQDSLETLFLTNIVILAISTSYVSETSKNQLALVNISMAISFILFLVILGFHFYKYILEGTRVWARVTQCFQRREHVPNRHQRYQLAPLEEEEPIIDQDTVSLDSNSQLREPDLDILDPVYTDDYRDPPASPVVHQPPNITYTVIDGRPGHRDGVPVSCGLAGQSLQEMA